MEEKIGQFCARHSWVLMARRYAVEFRCFNSGVFWRFQEVLPPGVAHSLRRKDQEGMEWWARTWADPLRTFASASQDWDIAGADEGTGEKGSFPLPSPRRLIGLENKDRHLVLEPCMFMGRATLDLIEVRWCPIHQQGDLEKRARSPSHTTAWEETITSKLFHTHSEPSTPPLLLQFNLCNSPSR